jgi:nucleoside-diphosphate-sugar epimerase
VKIVIIFNNIKKVSRMDKCKVLVTGTSGYIGRHVVSTLLNMGYDVFASDFQFAGVDERAKRISPVSYDDVNIYEKLSRPDISIHLA